MRASVRKLSCWVRNRTHIILVQCLRHHRVPHETHGSSSNNNYVRKVSVSSFLSIINGGRRIKLSQLHFGRIWDSRRFFYLTIRSIFQDYGDFEMSTYDELAYFKYHGFAGSPWEVISIFRVFLKTRKMELQHFDSRPFKCVPVASKIFFPK